MSVLMDGVRVPRPEPQAPPASEPVSPARAGSPADFSKVFEHVGRSIDGGEELVGKAERAAYAPMDAGTLIALQAGIYRYSEAIDLTAKVVDRVTSAVRTVLQAGH